MISGDRFIFSNSIAYDDLADYIISLSTDIGVVNSDEIQSKPSLFLDGVPYSMDATAESLGLCLHTKKAKQNPDTWNTALTAIRNEMLQGEDFLGNNVKDSTFKFLLTSRVNFKISNDLFPGSKNYLATFLDCVYLNIRSQINPNDFIVFNNDFDLSIFDDEINSMVTDDLIIHFNDSDNYVATIVDLIINRYPDCVYLPSPEKLYQLIDQKPWYLVKDLIMTVLATRKIWPTVLLGQLIEKFNTFNDEHVFATLSPILAVISEKNQQKIPKALVNPDIVLFDMGMLYTNDQQASLDTYNEFCEKISITPNTRAFLDVRQQLASHRTDSVGIDVIPEPYGMIFNMIARVILNKNNIFLDTSLNSLGWNITCQTILMLFLQDQGKEIDIDYRKFDTVGDIIFNI